MSFPIKAAAILFLGACAIYALSSAADNHSGTGNTLKKDSDVRNRDKLFQAMKTRNIDLSGQIVNANVTIQYVKSQIRSMFESPLVKKVALIETMKLIRSLEEVGAQWNAEALQDCTHLFCSVDYRGNVRDVIPVRNIGGDDPEVTKLLGAEKMVVITR